MFSHSVPGTRYTVALTQELPTMFPYIPNAPVATVTTHLAADGAQVFEATNGFFTVVIENDSLAPLVELRADLGEAGYNIKLTRFEMSWFEAGMQIAAAGLASPAQPWSVEHLPPGPGCVDDREVLYFVRMALGGFKVHLSEEQLTVTPHDAMGRSMAEAAMVFRMDDTLVGPGAASRD